MTPDEQDHVTRVNAELSRPNPDADTEIQQIIDELEDHVDPIEEYMDLHANRQVLPGRIEYVDLPADRQMRALFWATLLQAFSAVLFGASILAAVLL